MYLLEVHYARHSAIPYTAPTGLYLSHLMMDTAGVHIEFIVIPPNCFTFLDNKRDGAIKHGIGLY